MKGNKSVTVHLTLRRCDDQLIEALPNCLVLRVAEDLLSGGIELDDAAAVVHGHDRVERRLDDRGLERLAFVEFSGPRLDLSLDLFMQHFQGGLSPYDVPHLSDASAARPNQKEILEEDPADMLHPPPGLDHDDAVDGLRPE